MNKLFGLFSIAITLFLSSSVHAADEDELLRPEEAFKTSASIDENNNITVSIDIADGYYLYRKKIKLQSKTDSVTLSEIQSPNGKVKQDEFFGEIETYRHQVSITSSVSKPFSADSFKLKVISQGCADLGICYPPMTLSFDLKLNPQNQAEKAKNTLSSLAQSLGGGFNNDDEPLDPELAFSPSVKAITGNTIPVSWTIAEGYYLYKDKLAFELLDTNGKNLGKAQLSKGKIKDDPYFGKIEVYRQFVDAKIPLITQQDSGEGVLRLTYQGCADIGICYPPQHKEIPFSWSGISNAAAATLEDQTKAPTKASNNELTEQDQLANSLSSDSLWGVIFSFFGLGLLLAFTPCVFPMIPILSSIIVGQGESITTAKSFLYSVVFVLSMAVTYTVAGIAVGLSGENVQALFQDPWILSSFALLFVVLSFSMFGFYELQMPGSIQNKLTSISNNQKGGTLVGVAIMGFLSALIVGPCVTAPLIGALIYIAQTGDAVIGGIALFSLSIGMGIPLIIIGVSAGKFMPRAGAWMEVTKSIFGVMLLGLAIWMLDRFLPLSVIMAISATLLIVVSIYMGAIEPISDAASGWSKLWKGFGLVMLAYGLMLLIGAASGGTSFISPLKGIISSSSNGAVNNAVHLTFKTIKTVGDLETELKQAKLNKQTVMLDFYADWCISCKEMESFTFSDVNVQKALANTLLLQADVTANDDADKALLKHFGLFGPPAIIFYDANSQEQRNSRIVGFMDAEKFAGQVNKAFR